MIITENLTKQFGQKVAVNELSLHVDRGEFFSFLGPNGAGKTTTIKMLVGLLAPTSGKALIGTFDVRENHVAAKRLIGYIPDQPFLYEKLTGREFMRFVGGLYEMDDAVVQSRTEDLLELFSVGFSGKGAGESLQKRVDILGVWGAGLLGILDHLLKNGIFY